MVIAKYCKFDNLQLLLYPIIILLAKTPWRGAQTAIYCAVTEELKGVSGYHFVNSKQKPIPLPPKLQSDEVAKQLWVISNDMTRRY